MKGEEDMGGEYDTHRWGEMRYHNIPHDPNHGRLRSSSTESSSDMHTKRHRAGSISGRLRAASDLEECGLIDKNQKGVLKVI